ncbi:hypothetical protein ABZ930_04335 [Streptomyces sp. NPDC046716]|uniref:hypothetical protein n=1 Tax=Streptomyces sp. NPDC046716 TaxID=3157093 RepID=UPI0033CBA827
MSRTAQDDRPVPPTGDGPRRGIVPTAFGVLRRHRAQLAGATVRVVGLSGLVWLLLTAAVFALSWQLFTTMRNRVLYYHYNEDPYLHDHSDLVLVALWTLPLFLLLLGTGSATLQWVCSRAVAAGTDERRPERPRLRPMLTVYLLRGFIVWTLPLVAYEVAHRLTGSQLDTPLPLERDSWAYAFVSNLPLAALVVAAVLRLALALAPAAVADGLGARAALRRSWRQTTTLAGSVRVLALAVPLAVVVAAVLRLVVQVALPLRPAVRGLVEGATGNFFAGYYAGLLAPVIVGILCAAALVLPVSCTVLAVLHDRLPARSPASNAL